MILPKDFERYFRERWCDEDVAALVAGLLTAPASASTASSAIAEGALLGVAGVVA